MLDASAREINYMRISITDRCNLRCIYCMPQSLKPLSHGDILRYEEILRICKIAVKMGIQRFKITGGEPLVRMGCVEFLRKLKSVNGITSVTLTTNGVLLEDFVEEIAAIELDGVNISIDSICPETYQKITGFDVFPNVWRSLNKAVQAGLRTKINCVPMRGLNDNNINSIARLAENMPVDVRFIVFMPAQAAEPFEMIPGNELLERILEACPDLKKAAYLLGAGPAYYYKGVNMKGSIGIIDTASCCAECNRVRLTSEGFLKLCLFRDEGLDLRAILRGGADDREIESAMRNAIFNKPKHRSSEAVIKNMSRIGG